MTGNEQPARIAEVQVSTWMTEAEAEALRAYAAEHDRSVSWVIRDAVRRLLDGRKK